MLIIMEGYVALAVVVGIVIVVVILAVINFLKSVMKRFSGWRGGRFTPEENAAYYRGLARGRVEGRLEGMSAFMPRMRSLGGRRVHQLDDLHNIEPIERPDDARYIDSDRAPRTYLPRKKIDR